MSFQEKSAWVMLVALSIGGWKYFGTVAAHSNSIHDLVAPAAPDLVRYAVLLVLLVVAGHVVAAIMSPEDADSSLDERDRQIFNRAGHLSGYVLGGGALTAMCQYLLTTNGHLMFYIIFASLMLGQIAEYGLQLALYRRAS